MSATSLLYAAFLTALDSADHAWTEGASGESSNFPERGIDPLRVLVWAIIGACALVAWAAIGWGILALLT